MREEFIAQLKNQLNEQQFVAVTYIGGPSLVIAGAGSGKTRVLTYKISYLLQEGIPPSNILALTFTNKAAREMKERIATLVGQDLASGLWMGTFHSMFLRILRAESAAIDYPPRFTIYDETDRQNLIKAIVRELSLDEQQYKPNVVARSISTAKNNLITPDRYSADRQQVLRDQAAKRPQTAQIYSIYMQRLKQAAAMDFDDLLLQTHRLFRQNPEILNRYAKKFNFVLIDEYQDTNYAQASIAWQLTEKSRAVCVVGDDAQSIYSFRGANIDNILTFNKQYPESITFKLERNYRSTQTIVGAADSLIAHNTRQIPKQTFSLEPQGAPIQITQAYSDIEEAEIVATQIDQLRTRHNLTFDQIAVLYRTNAQSRTFEETFRRHNIPYHIYGGLSFYQRKEIKDTVAYLRLAVNPDDEEALRRVINYPARGIGQTTLDKIYTAAAQQSVSPHTIIANPSAFNLNLPTRALANLAAFHTLVDNLHTQAANLPADQMLQYTLTETTLRRTLSEDTTPEGISKLQNLQELAAAVDTFITLRTEEQGQPPTLYDFLQDIALLTDADRDNDDPQTPRVSLMTVHAAKGLEFRAVFIVGMEENLFPSPMAIDHREAMEEERRLFYVALTRAKEHCHISYSRTRFRYGQTEYTRPSRFLADIDTRYLRFSPIGHSPGPSHRPKPLTPIGKQQPAAPVAPPKTITSALTSDGKAIAVGNTVEHSRFGLGTVKNIAEHGGEKLATIEFENSGTKKLLLRFARLRVVK